MDNSCDSVNPLAIGIFARFGWWLNPYIAGCCYYRYTDQNNPRAQTFVTIPVRRVNSDKKAPFGCKSIVAMAKHWMYPVS
jgi:hypothetical protein